jgi:hypothetical protein
VVTLGQDHKVFLLALRLEAVSIPVFCGNAANWRVRLSARCSRPSHHLVQNSK